MKNLICRIIQIQIHKTVALIIHYLHALESGFKDAENYTTPNYLLVPLVGQLKSHATRQYLQ